MEYVDLYDEHRNPLARAQPRRAPRPGEYCIAVGVWIFNDRGEIFLTKRHPDKKFAPNLWENTGGHARSGECSRAAAVRELFEETGVSAGEDEVALIGTVRVAPYLGDNYVLYRAFDAANAVLQPGETCGAMWVTLDRFNAMAASGELAPSVVEHLQPIRPAWERALALAPGRCRR